MLGVLALSSSHYSSLTEKRQGPGLLVVHVRRAQAAVCSFLTLPRSQRILILVLCASCTNLQGKWQLALELVERMKADGVTPTLTTYSSAADACAKGGNW